MLDLIRWRSNKSPDRQALFFNGRWYTYAEMNQRANQMANRLLDLGIRRGDRVGILALNHTAHFDLLFAAAKIGFIFTPLNHRLTARELGLLAREVKPSLIFTDTRHQALAEEIGAPWARLSDYTAWLKVGSAQEPPAPTPPLSGEDAHMILFTGGTTGLPKGATLPYRQTLLNARLTAETWGFSNQDCTIQCTPCFHAALNAVALPMFYKAGRVVLMSKFDADEYLGHVALHGATHLFMVPSMYQILAQHFDFAEANLRSVKVAISGGAPCNERIRSLYARRGVRIVQGYGLTEAGVNCFASSFLDPDLPFEKVGKPMPQMEMRVVDDHGALCPAGTTGELQLKSDMVFSGYWERPEETEKVLKNGWLSTGDMVQVDEQGNYTIMGRKKDLYITGGEKVYPQEVEAVLGQLPQVAECAVLGVSDPRWGEQGLAAIVSHNGHPIPENELREALQPHIASYKLPRYFFFLRNLPRNAAGKVSKDEIRRMFESAGTVQKFSHSLTRYT